MAGKQLRECSLFTAQAEKQALDKAIEAFFAVAENKERADTFAIFYAPHKCFLAKHDGKQFEVKEKGFDLTNIFEARIFNGIAEMRWLNDASGSHTTAILSETQLVFDGKTLQAESKVIGGLCQNYLLWGRSLEENPDKWTKFAEARIGEFSVPIEIKRNDKDEKSGYAQFVAVEYLKEFDDGNVSVFDERLTGLKIYEGESSNA